MGASKFAPKKRSDSQARQRVPGRGVRGREFWISGRTKPGQGGARESARKSTAGVWPARFRRTNTRLRVASTGSCHAPWVRIGIGARPKRFGIKIVGNVTLGAPQGAVQGFVYVACEGRHDNVDAASRRDVKLDGVEARLVGVSQGFIGANDLSPKHRPEEHWHGEV